MLFIVFAFNGFSQNQTYSLTIKITITGGSTSSATSSIIKIDPDGIITTTTGPSIFSNTEQHEKAVNSQINSITTLGYQLVNSSEYAYGGTTAYYIITRYIFK